MSIKRVISIVLLVIMCAALLAGCAGNNLAPGEPFSFWQKLEVNRVMNGKLNFVDEGGRWMYFGVYDDAMVIYSDGSLLWMTYVSIAGCYFEFPTDATPHVIYKGKHYGFEEAYKEGILSANAVAQIHAYFTSDQYRDDRYGQK